MDKKGQVYLIVSLIIGLVVFVLTAKPNILNISPTDDDFKDISENYNYESARFLNSMLREKEGELTSEEITKGFSDFTGIFTQYSKSQNPTFGLIYLLSYGGNLFVGNYLDKEIIYGLTGKRLPGCFEKINATIKYGVGGISDVFDLQEFSQCTDTISSVENLFFFSISGEDVVYEASIIEGQPEVIIVSRERILEHRKVFVENKHIKGKKEKFEEFKEKRRRERDEVITGESGEAVLT